MPKFNSLAHLLGRELNQCGDDNFVTPVKMGESIPLVVHQCFFNSTLSTELKHNTCWLKSLNPDWEFKVYDDYAMEHYIEINYPNLLHIYRKINPKYGAARVDFFRYLLIYKEGGVYLDIKSSFNKPLDEIILVDDKYILSQWPDGDGYEKWGMYEDISNQFGEFQQWHIISVKGHPFLKAVIENVCKNIMNYSPFLHQTGKYGVIRTTGPIAYTLAITPHLERLPHRLVRSHTDLYLVYTIFAVTDVHHSLFKNHYTMLKESLINLSYLSNILFQLYQKTTDYLLLLYEKIANKINRLNGRLFKS